MSQVRLKKGLNMKLKGLPERVLLKCPLPASYAIKPADFHGLAPKVLLAVGDAVKAGTPVLCDAHHPEILIASPVSGRIQAINYGRQQELTSVLIQPDGEQSSAAPLAVPDLSAASRGEVLRFMLRSGAWPFLVQRPYGTIADPQATPKAIFISGFDTAPLAADVDYTVNNEHEPFQVGVNALQKLTAGQVHLSLCADYPMSSTFRRLKGLEVHHFKGPHPSGNVGVQIHHIDPISKGDVVWTIRPQHVVALGKLLTSGVYDVTRVVALVGSEVKRPRYYRIAAGASLGCLSEFVRDGGQGKRVISGNVLTGADVGADGYLGFYDSEVTVIPEGRYYEALGWLRLRLRKFSMSRSYFSWLMPAREYAPDTNRNGERSPFVLTGQYERVLPMDILPVYLLKAIMAEDLPRMEQLGIYEVVEEDLALCEFVCASKVNVQQLLRRGISLMMAAGYPKVAQ